MKDFRLLPLPPDPACRQGKTGGGILRKILGFSPWSPKGDIQKASMTKQLSSREGENWKSEEECPGFIPIQSKFLNWKYFGEAQAAPSLHLPPVTLSSGESAGQERDYYNFHYF